jgi:hypothetical protein
MCDETELDILNHCLEVLVQSFSEELLPVAAELASRLVRNTFAYSPPGLTLMCTPQCTSYMRMLKEYLETEGAAPETETKEEEQNRTYAMLSLTKAIGTVRLPAS